MDPKPKISIRRALLPERESFTYGTQAAMYIAAKSPIMSIMHQIVPAMTFAIRRVPFLTGRVWVKYPSSEYVLL